MNRGAGVANGKAKSSNEAVVLTLRKRFSSVRRKRTKSLGPGVDVSGNIFNADAPFNPTAASTASSHEDLRRNPWQSDASLARSHSLPGPPHPQLAHRLSFDDGTGVITLPDDAGWLMEDVDDSDSEEDYGSTSPAASGIVEDDSQVSGPGGDEDALANASTSSAAIVTSTPISSPTKQRHGIYYHHPEKRKQTIPGAFPRSFK